MLRWCLMTSIYGVVVLRLMSDARRAVKELLGSAIISQVGFRDNYVIIGKHGLPSGSAVEAVRLSLIELQHRHKSGFYM